MVTASGAMRANPGTSKRSLAKDSNHHLFDPEQAPGWWEGDGPKIFELGPIVKQLVMEHLAKGFSPDGKEKLVQNAGAPDRQSLWQFNFVPPKDVSVLIALAPEEFKPALIRCLTKAASAGVRYFEDVAGLTRRGEGGTLNEKAACFWSLFLHDRSQAGDPHFHIHAILMNLCVRADGTTGAIRSIDFYREMKAAGAVFNAELVSELRNNFGLKIKPLEKAGFQIEGVPEDLCRAMSKRGTAIKEVLQERGTESGEAGRFAALNTRPDKEVISNAALHARWKQTARSFGFGEEEVRKLLTAEREKKSETVSFEKAFRTAVSQVPEKKRIRPDIIEVGRKFAIDHGASGDRLRKAFAEQLPKKQGFVHVEWRPVFKKAPFWSPARLLKAPVVVIGNPKQHRKWGNILWEKNTNFGQARLQERYLFPKAPGWSPLSKVKVPALRVGKMRLREKELWGKTNLHKKVFGGEFRIQQRKLFPRALKWNPAGKLTIPVPRFAHKAASKPTPRKFQTNGHQQSH